MVTVNQHVRRRGIGLIALISAAACAAPALAEDYWLKDPVSGCQIWDNEPPSADEVVTWTGACKDDRAFGDGLLIWKEGGSLLGRYEGEMAGGKMNGKGVLTVKAESGPGYDRLKGTFQDGEPEGHGIFIGANGDFYEGEFKAGKKNGPGVFRGASGDYFEGTMIDGAAQGRGYTIAADGEEYLGGFKDDERHGPGILIENDGSIYYGQFDMGFASGFGRIEEPDGIYEGQFEKGKPSGSGTFTAPNGDVYQGLFVDGALDGKVLVTRDGGEQTVETWKSGKKVP